MADNGYKNHIETVYMEIGPSGKKGGNGNDIQSVQIDYNRTSSGLGRTEDEKKPCMPSAVHTPGNPFISKVAVYDWSTYYNYYSAFRNDALKHIADVPGTDTAEYVPFFSYMPQYSQLDVRQFAYYVRLRHEIRNGNYPEADYSYLLLLIYEAVNLSDVNDTECTLDLLISVWKGYRNIYPRLDTQLGDWICDFCLIHGMDFPYEKTGIPLSSFISQTSFREFYLGSGIHGNELSEMLIRFCSGYNYSKSKFAQGENSALYNSTMHGVVECIFGDIRKDGSGLGNIALHRTKISRDAYVGALCIPAIKKRLEIEYLSVSHSFELKFLVSDILRYTENRLRAYLKVKSRISSPALPEDIKKKADEYFQSAGLGTPTVHKTETHDYDRLYDVPDAPVSIENAEKIESESWITTDLLTEAFDGGQTDRTEEVPSTVLPATVYPDPDSFGILDTGSGTVEALFEALDDEEGKLIEALSKGDEKALDDALRSSHRPISVMIRRINDAAAEIFGDILIDMSDGSPAILEDYSDDITRYLGSSPEKTDS